MAYKPPSKTMTEAKELYHFGIPGMKHGKRRSAHYPLKQEQFSPEELKNGAKESVWANGDPNAEHREDPNSKNQNGSNEPPKEVIKNKDYYKKHSASEMSEQEIREAIARIELEDRYDRMTGQNQVVEKGESTAKKAMKAFAAKSATTLAEDLGGRIGRNVSKAISDSLFGSEEQQKEESEKKKTAAEEHEEKKMLKTIDKKIKKAKEDGKPIQKALSKKELEFLSDRYNKEENAKKALGLWEDKDAKNASKVSEAVRRARRASDEEEFMAWASANLDAANAKAFKNLMSDLHSGYSSSDKIKNTSSNNKGNSSSPNKSNSNKQTIGTIKYSNLKDIYSSEMDNGALFINTVDLNSLYDNHSTKNTNMSSYAFGKKSLKKKKKKK